MSNVVIVCGGTGGHLTPGVAIAQELTKRGHVCHLIISQKKVDSRLASKYPLLNFYTFAGVLFSLSPVKFIKFIVGLTQSIFTSRRLMKNVEADVVVGFGGFLTVGVVIAGNMLRLPIVLHEANRHPGRTIRLLKNLADRIYLPRGIDLGKLTKNKVKHYGYPVRPEITSMDKGESLEKLGFVREQKMIFVLGGSQGARSLNNWVSENYEYFLKNEVSLYCVTGDYEGENEEQTIAGSSAKLILTPFCDAMYVPLSAADLIISRAGAGSIAEIVRCHVPSVLVPFPFSADQHQLKNAKYLENGGGCSIVMDSNLDELRTQVESLIFCKEDLAQLRLNLKNLDNQNDLDEIVGDVEWIMSGAE